MAENAQELGFLESFVSGDTQKLLLFLSLVGVSLYFGLKQYFEQNKKVDVVKRRRRTLSNAARKAINLPVLPIKPVDWNELFQGSLRVWSKELDKLPVSIDLPRLARHMTITGNKNNSQKAQKTGNELFSVLVDVARAVDSDVMVKNIQQKFSQYVKNDPTGVQSRELQKFLVEVVGEKSKVVQVLKACNQSILAPAVLQLRLNVCAQLPFKDGGDWRIRVVVDDKAVNVYHIRHQKQLRTDGKKEDFEFEWEYRLTFNRDLTELINSSFRISDVKFTEMVSDKIKQEVLGTFRHVREHHKSS